MEIVDICISSLDELEEVIRKLDPRGRVVVSYDGAETIFEAAVIYRRLESLVESSQGRWEVDPGKMEVLRRCAEYYEALGLLEIQLDLVDLDLKAGISMKSLRFDGVRVAANDVVTSAHPNTGLAILDDITIEAQRVARVTKALGFGAPDVDFPKLTDDDIDWMAAEDGGGGSTEVQIAALVNNAPKLEPLYLDNKRDQDHGPSVEVALEDGHRTLCHKLVNNTEAKICGLTSSAHKIEPLHLNNKQSQDDGSLETKDGCGLAYRDWLLTKEEHMVLVLGSKIEKLRALIDAAKSSAVL